MIYAKWVLTLSVMILSCNSTNRQERIKEEIFKTEKAFEKMVAERGVSAAFSHFAAENAVIKRGDTTLLSGPENIREYYLDIEKFQPEVFWTPDYIDVSSCGTMAYTYGSYLWRIKDENGLSKEIRGIFHTVWKKQEDGSWKYVWD